MRGVRKEVEEQGPEGEPGESDVEINKPGRRRRRGCNVH